MFAMNSSRPIISARALSSYSRFTLFVSSSKRCIRPANHAVDGVLENFMKTEITNLIPGIGFTS